MCGIGVVIGDCSIDDVPDVLQRRGPDYKSRISLDCVTLMATALHMRGEEMVKQPKSIENLGMLCWNGEIYQYMCSSCRVCNNNDFSLLEVPPQVSDTDIVAELLLEELERTKDSQKANTTANTTASASASASVHASLSSRLDISVVVNAISRIWNGEFAFCFLTHTSLYFGRDILGRRSLLTSQDKDGVWKLSSVATSMEDTWLELPPGRVYEYNLVDQTIQFSPLTTFPRIPLTRSILDCHPLALNTPNISKPRNVTDSMWIASIQFEQILREAVHRRLVSNRNTDPIGVMFSGGLDSVVLAAMAASHLQSGQSLELFNVTFGNGKAADRVAGLQCYQELRALFPEKDIKLVLVDIEQWEMVLEEENGIKMLMNPKTSVMDFNIATALWFASRGTGICDNKPFKSNAKILILGMGADEQLGGYGRHRKAHSQGKLREELSLDIDRIWERNMGRDDRIISDHGKEARYPYLDPNVMQFLALKPVEDLCDFSAEPGQGDKRILRLVAQRMQLSTASSLVKRAIQFGSRMSHLSDTRRFGSRRLAKGTLDFRQKKIEQNFN